MHEQELQDVRKTIQPNMQNSDNQGLATTDQTALRVVKEQRKLQQLFYKFYLWTKSNLLKAFLALTNGRINNIFSNRT